MLQKDFNNKLNSRARSDSEATLSCYNNYPENN